MSGYTSIDDSAFDRQVSLRDAYRVMEHFVVAYAQRGELGTGELLAYLGVATDGRTGDPAALDDYLAAVDAVLSPQDGRVG